MRINTHNLLLCIVQKRLKQDSFGTDRLKGHHFTTCEALDFFQLLERDVKEKKFSRTILVTAVIKQSQEQRFQTFHIVLKRQTI